MTEHHSVIVIGAGLSGLYTTWQLQQQHQDVFLLEARERCGGRILSATSASDTDIAIDMGPAWIWPQLQPRLRRLVSELDLKLFKQFTTGDILYESAANKIERYNGQSAHSESYRIVGGKRQLINALQSRLTESSIQLETQVQSIQKEPLSIHAMHHGKPQNFTAEHIILALPPRISLQSISFKPALFDDIIQLWKSIPTWMAGHAKVVFIYDNPFWRDQGLSGEVFSHYGPLSEIYDASPADESFYALTSFTALNAQQRRKITADQLLKMCMAQLHRLFGENSKNTSDIQIKDWSQDVYTAAEIDLTSAMQHPQYPATMPRSLWNKNLILAGSEVAAEHGGYLEGALESADEAVKIILNT